MVVRAPGWPESYIAFGDSYAAGIGAGKFYKPEDRSNKACKRFTGSYPVLLSKLGLFNHGATDFSFPACTGDVIDDLEYQFGKVPGKRAHVVTLSIGGNDFDFAPVVLACVYNYNVIGDRDKECDAALAKAEEHVKNETIWANYRTKVKHILDNHMTSEAAGEGASVLLITGT